MEKHLYFSHIYDKVKSKKKKKKKRIKKTLYFLFISYYFFFIYFFIEFSLFHSFTNTNIFYYYIYKSWQKANSMLSVSGSTGASI